MEKYYKRVHQNIDRWCRMSMNKKEKKLLDCVSGKYRLGFEPRTYCKLNNHTTAVLTKYPHDLASTHHLSLRLFKAIGASMTTVLLHVLLFYKCT